MSNAVAVTDADFEQEIEKHDGLAVVDFWATWCGPCRMIAPILDQLAIEYQGKAKVAKLDVDSNIRTATRFNVRSIPAVLFFKNGKLVDQVIGAVPKPALESKFKQHARRPNRQSRNRLRQIRRSAKLRLRGRPLRRFSFHPTRWPHTPHSCGTLTGVFSSGEPSSRTFTFAIS